MCGRLVCSLSKEQIQKACVFVDPSSTTYEPLKWQDAQNGGFQYTPSYNVCPTNITPVIVAADEGPVLTPMLWGIIPPWHKGEYNTHKMSTNNCRIESITASKLYNPPVQRGQRCVVVCDGFYEWQTTKTEKNKQPYFIYAPQLEHIQIDNPEGWPVEFSTEKEWCGPRPLYMAAIFSPWTSHEGQEFLTYSIITMESNSTLSWLHHRMPAILHSKADIMTWINRENTAAQALSILKPANELKWHPVSTEVNNSRNKTAGLNKAIDLTKEYKSKSATLMETWLLKGKSSCDSSSSSKPPEKKHKSS